MDRVPLGAYLQLQELDLANSPWVWRRTPSRQGLALTPGFPPETGRGWAAPRPHTCGGHLGVAERAAGSLPGLREAGPGTLTPSPKGVKVMLTVCWGPLEPPAVRQASHGDGARPPPGSSLSAGLSQPTSRALPVGTGSGRRVQGGGSTLCGEPTCRLARLSRRSSPLGPRHPPRGLGLKGPATLVP
ncbi:unnamed protein product [Rangifer tarandus platyrhynchus]|uniref:Uncharacterized protein n=3 Tax=Rangifer tarandus platyrhynchus TaxID=3082113 RepID=A0ACB0DZP6_RANTA|nr:unnamed protein product [Rangifer tarandus platyrhynchus]CAI9693672.1 unnamed protein product [Rangifer tarandus platyrhynchus]